MLRRDGQAGEERRAHLLNMLRESKELVKAAEMARTTGVSRQVIVQDIALLRARKEPIIATPQGYVYLPQQVSQGVQKVIMSRHLQGDAEKELNILVDHGVYVLDVGIEHSVYGRIFRPLKIKTRLDVKNFIKKLADTEASLLSSLTNGLHLHTLEAPNQEVLDQACAELAKQGFLIE